MLRRLLSVSSSELEKEPIASVTEIVETPWMFFFVYLMLPWMALGLTIYLYAFEGLELPMALLLLMLNAGLFKGYRESLSRFYRWRVIARSTHAEVIRQLCSKLTSRETIDVMVFGDWLRQLQKAWRTAHQESGLVRSLIP